MMRPSGKIYSLCLCLLFLSACSTQPPVKTQSASDRLIEVADQREAAGDYEGAVDYYLRAAAIAPDDERQGVLLQAATSLMELGEIEREAGAWFLFDDDRVIDDVFAARSVLEIVGAHI